MPFPHIQAKTLQEIAKALEGELQVKNSKEQNLLIDSLAVSPCDSTQDDLVIVFEQKYLKDILAINAKAMILPTNVKGKISPVQMPIIWVERPRLTLKKLLHLFGKKIYIPQAGIDKSAILDPLSKVATSSCIGANVFIGADSKIGEDTIIYPNVFIGSNVVVGNNVVIYPNCSIYDYTEIRNRVILQSGVVIGSDGYSYVTSEESNLEKAKKGDFNFNLGRQIQNKIPSIGNVIIEDDVEIGANSCVDRGTIGPTVIGEGTKIDNLVQIAHNCHIGKDCLIVGQVGFAGSVRVGDRVVAGGQAGFADNINIGDDVIFVARSAVHGNVPACSVYMGMPAVPYQEYFKGEKTIKRLPKKYEQLESQVKELENKVRELEQKTKSPV